MPSGDTQSATVSYVAPEDLTSISTYISNLAGVVQFDTNTERDVQKLLEIVNFYQEQPHVLDPHLQPWIERLLELGMGSSSSQVGVNLAFRYLYLLTKVRGHKYITRLLPHQVSDVERVLAMLESERSAVWHAKYVLFLWLSILVLIPFDLKRLDGEREEGWAVRRMLNIAQSRVVGSDKSSEAAALVVAKLVTRPDLHEAYLRVTLENLVEAVKATQDDPVFGSGQKLGTLTALARIYKLGRRDYLLPHSPYLLDQLFAFQLGASVNTLLRKFQTKLAQRIGLSFLPPRVAKWRYTRGTRLLADSFKEQPTTQHQEEEEEAEEEEEDTPAQLEGVLEVLFGGLRDPETIVRWSSAKGVGRITARLPRSLAGAVVEQLMGCFSPLETASSWHGGCLALAELGRHGFLSPSQLPDIVPVLVQALQYDEKRGHMVLGANVRDAACYLCWSFARTFPPDEIAPFVGDIASALILTTLFDRNIGCRRAASAAFQENVGRQGSFPHGISILTTCDYYAVALLTNTYDKLALAVASFDPYCKPIINHLAEVKVKHWCPNIRKLASACLGKLCTLLPDYMASSILPLTLSYIAGGNFNARLGALHAIGDICLGLTERLELIGEKERGDISNTLHVLTEMGCFKGTGGDEIRVAVAYYISRVSMSGLPLEDPTLVSWLSHLNTSLVNPEQVVGVQEMAVTALHHFTHQHYTPTWDTHLVPHYLSQLHHELASTRIGAGLGLSVLPAALISPHTQALIAALAPCTKVNSKAEVSLAEVRVSAVKALTNVQLVGECNAESRARIYQVLLECLEDYSTDSRGDIGSYVREAAMTSLRRSNAHILALGHPLIALTFTSQLKLRLVRGFLQQSLEKIDRTRQVALEALHHLVWGCGVGLEDEAVLREAVPYLDSLTSSLSTSVMLPVTPQEKAGVSQFLSVRGELAQLGAAQLGAAQLGAAQLGAAEQYLQNVEYNNPATVFPRALGLLGSEWYRYSAMRGLVVSIGGLTESLVRASSSAFIDYLTEDTLPQVCSALISVLQNDSKNDRVVVPLFKTVDLLLNNAVIEDVLGNHFTGQLVQQIKVEVKGCGNVPKLLAIVSPLANCLQFTENKPVITQIMVLLCHRYPRVRKGMADAFYTSLVTFDDVTENVEEVSGVLESTVWEDPNDINELRAKRNQICDLMGVPQPKLIASSKPKARVKTSEQFDSYSDLVGRAGY